MQNKKCRYTKLNTYKITVYADNKLIKVDCLYSSTINKTYFMLYFKNAANLLLYKLQHMYLAAYLDSTSSDIERDVCTDVMYCMYSVHRVY